MAFRRPVRRRVAYSDGSNGGFRTLLWVAVLTALGGGVYFGIPKLRDHIVGDDSGPSAKAPKKAAPGPIGRSSPNLSAGSTGSTGGSAAAREIRSPHVELNVAVMAKESERYAGNAAAEARHRDEAVRALARFRDSLRGKKEPDHLDPEDQILALDDIDLTRMVPGDAASHLKRMLRQIPKGTFLKFNILRGSAQRQVYAYFPTGTGIAGAGGDTGRVPISSALATEIQQEVLTLTPFYLPGTEREDIVKILAKGETTPEEYALITRRLSRFSGGPSVAQQDKVTFEKKIAELGAKLATTPVSDVIVTKDGREISGTLIEDKPPGPALIETPLGRVPVARAEIKYFRLSTDQRQEFRNKLATAQTELYPEAWPSLLNWTQHWNMLVHREYVAYLMLRRDPADGTARMAAGYTRGADGRWSYGPKASEARKPETRAEVQAELESIGLTLRNGKWFSKESWTAVIDTLHVKPPLKMTLEGVVLQSWDEEDTPTFRLAVPNGKPKTGPDAGLRFLTPQGASGTIHIVVEAPGEIDECQVKAVGAVIGSRQGKLEVYVTPEGGARPHLLYLIEEAGNSGVHDVTLPLRGKRKFTVSARMTNAMDKYQAYARFLPSLPGSQEVFTVSARILQPAPAEIERIWATAK